MAKAKKPAKKPAPKRKPVSTKRMMSQKEIPGMEEEKDERVHGPALYYAEVRDERCALSKKEDEAKTSLMNAMLEAGLKRYQYRDLTVDLTEGKKDVKVKIATPSDNGDGEGSEE